MGEAARRNRPSPYRRGEAAERERWIRAAYIVLQCVHCRRLLVAGEPSCPMCLPVRRLAEPERVR